MGHHLLKVKRDSYRSDHPTFLHHPFIPRTRTDSINIYYRGQIWIKSGQTAKLSQLRRRFHVVGLSFGVWPGQNRPPSRLSAIMTYFKLARSRSSTAARLSAHPCVTERLSSRRRHQPIKINRATESTQQHSCYVMQRCPSFTPLRRRFCCGSSVIRTISCVTHKHLQTMTNEWRATSKGQCLRDAVIAVAEETTV